MTSARDGPPRSSTATTASSCSSAASATRSTSRSGERTLSSFENYRVLASERAVRRPKTGRRSTVRTMRAAAPAHRAQPGRTRLALRPAAGRGQPAAAGHRPGGHQPAPRQQLEPAVRAAGLRRLLQPRQPLAGLGGQRRAVAWARPCWACTAASSRCALALLWWRDHAAVTSPAAARPAPAAYGRMKTVRRLLYRDIVGFGDLRGAGLPVAVLLHRLRRRTRRRRPPRPRRLAGGAGRRCWKCRGTSTSCSRSRC